MPNRWTGQTKTLWVRSVSKMTGELSLSEEEKMKASVEHYARLLNVEFEWPSDLLPEVAPVEGSPTSHIV